MRDIRPIIKKILPELITLRHELHSYPEPGYKEFETAKRIVAKLEKLRGVELRQGVAGTGIVALLGKHKPGKCLALRADMDCLPIQEQGGKPYASKNQGFMHACGHDGHMTCLIGAATVLTEIQDELNGPVKFIFQPAEENGAGGRKMCEEGVLENPNVQGVFALHGWPEYGIGQVGVKGGSVLASSDEFTIAVKGKGAHAAMPHYGVDPILVASHITIALQSIASRFTSPLDAVVVTVAILEAGTADNVIPSTAHMAGTIRALTKEARERAKALLQQIAQNTAIAFGAQAEVNLSMGYPPLINDLTAAAYVRDVAVSTLGAANVRDDGFPVMGAEDFAFYAEKIPAALWGLGVCPKGAMNFPQLHHPSYDFSDDAIATGVNLHCEIARQFAAHQAKTASLQSR